MEKQKKTRKKTPETNAFYRAIERRLALAESNMLELSEVAELSHSTAYYWKRNPSGIRPITMMKIANALSTIEKRAGIETSVNSILEELNAGQLSAMKKLV